MRRLECSSWLALILMACLKHEVRAFAQAQTPLLLKKTSGSLTTTLFREPMHKNPLRRTKVTPGGAGAMQASLGGSILMSFCRIPMPQIPRWVVYNLQQALVGTVFVQLVSVVLLCAGMVFAGAVILRLLVPNASKKGFSHWMFRSYVMLNKVTSNNPMVAETRREQILNNILFNCNILTISVITGLMAASAKTAVDQIINGNLPVIERGHTVLLMDEWNDQVVPIIQHFEALSKLPGAPRTLTSRPVVVLSNLAKSRATAIIEEGLSSVQGRRIKVLVRQGDPRHAVDLAKCCIESADKVLLLTGDSDRKLVKDGVPAKKLVRKVRQEASLLKESRTKVMSRMAPGTPTAVVAVPGDGQHWTKLESDFSVCEDQEFVGRLLAMCTIESSGGLSQVYNTVLKPNRGNFHETCAVGSSQKFSFLAGKTFDELQEHFPKSIVCGVVRGKDVILSPSRDFKVDGNDKIICFANHHCEVFASNNVKLRKDELHLKDSKPFMKQEWRKRAKRRILLLGWNERGQKTVNEIAQVSPKGSKLVTLDDSINHVIAAPGQELSTIQGDFMAPEDLAKAGAMDSDVIVCLFDSTSSSNTDPRTDSQLLTVIHALGKLPKTPGKKLPRLVAMVHTASTLPLLQQAAASSGITTDFILANDLESGALVQVLMRPSLEKVFNDMLSCTGHELLLLPCTRYMNFNLQDVAKDITFRELQVRARLYGHVAMGVLQYRDTPEQHKLVLNPDPQRTMKLGPKDRLVVLCGLKDAYLDLNEEVLQRVNDLNNQ